MCAVRLLLLAGIVSCCGLFATEARAVSPRNPYRTFNLSGVNYGSMQWERAQRQGKRVWPYYNTPLAILHSERQSGCGGHHGWRGCDHAGQLLAAGF